MLKINSYESDLAQRAFRLLLLSAALMLVAGLYRADRISTWQENDSNVEMCKCIPHAGGSWELVLSNHCIERCFSAFGDELQGMNEWYLHNCPKEARNPNKARLAAIGK